MDIAWFRDLVICVWGFVATLLLILVAVIIFLLYRKVKVVLNYIAMTSASIHRISSTVEDEVIECAVTLLRHPQEQLPPECGGTEQ